MKRRIEANKQGILSALHGERTRWLEIREALSNTRRARDEARGAIRGLDWAIKLIEDWELPS